MGPEFFYFLFDLFGTHHVHRITHGSLIMTYKFQCGPLMTCGGLEWEVESTTVTHSSADWGIFYFPWHRHQIEGTNSFYCLIRKTLASGVNGIAKVPKRKVVTEVGLESSNVQSQTRHNFVGEIRIFSVKIRINPYPSFMHRCIAKTFTRFISRCSLHKNCDIVY